MNKSHAGLLTSHDVEAEYLLLLHVSVGLRYYLVLFREKDLLSLLLSLYPHDLLIIDFQLTRPNLSSHRSPFPAVYLFAPPCLFIFFLLAQNHNSHTQIYCLNTHVHESAHLFSATRFSLFCFSPTCLYIKMCGCWPLAAVSAGGGIEKIIHAGLSPRLEVSEHTSSQRRHSEMSPAEELRGINNPAPHAAQTAASQSH